jgi:hypothetical protein
LRIWGKGGAGIILLLKVDIGKGSSSEKGSGFGIKHRRSRAEFPAQVRVQQGAKKEE